MKKDLVLLMEENNRSLGKSRGSRIMGFDQEKAPPEDEDENPGNPILEEDLEVEA